MKISRKILYIILACFFCIPVYAEDTDSRDTPEEIITSYYEKLNQIYYNSGNPEDIGIYFEDGSVQGANVVTALK